MNAVAPEAVTNAEFARALGRALRRPAILAVPGIAIRMLPGGMGREMLRTSEHVVPKTLLDCGVRTRRRRWARSWPTSRADRRDPDPLIPPRRVLGLHAWPGVVW